MATQLGSTLIIAVIVVAVVTVHLSKGFWVSAGGYEYNLVLATGALSLAFTGPGLYSLDSATDIVLNGIVPGVAALVVGLVLGGGALLSRKPRPVARAA